MFFICLVIPIEQTINFKFDKVLSVGIENLVICSFASGENFLYSSNEGLNSFRGNSWRLDVFD